MKAGSIVFVDTNVIIEAVDSGCWPAISGGLQVETVKECRLEARSGDRTRRGYVKVSTTDLKALSAVHPVPSNLHLAVQREYPQSAGLDPGERDLIAHIFHHAPDEQWHLCSPDKSCIQTAMALGWGDRLRSLEELLKAVGGKRHLDHPLRDHFLQKWLSDRRLEFLLSG